MIGTQTAGNVIKFFTGGSNSTSYIRGEINNTGLSMVGNVTANNIISTNATVGGTITATGNITGGNLTTAGTTAATTAPNSAAIVTTNHNNYNSSFSI